MSEPRPCPGCSRPNASHRVSCLYCGHTMPNPSSAPPPKRQRLSRELDRALDKALRGGNLGQVEQVLGQVESDASTAPRRPEPRVVLAFEQPSPALQDPKELFESLATHTAQATERWEDDPQGAQASLAQASSILRDLQVLAKALPEPAPIALPPFRLPVALLIEPPGDLEQAPELARALGLDLASARMHARAAHPKVVLRSGDLGDIQDRATRYSAQFQRPARPIQASDLRAIGRPMTALRIDPTTWVLASGGQWALEPGEIPPGAGSACEPPTFELAVPGEIIVATYRRRSEGVVPSGERRITVTDLHGPDTFVRVVAGHCTLPLPGESALRAHRAWLDALDCRVLGSRSCAPGEPPDARSQDPLQATGWANFEEHSRGARLLYIG
ncbi:MAG: hypothetical protein ACI9VR_000019 [Cognaticolwellia sp.]